MADFGILQTPNFAQAALGGYQAGQQIGKQRRMDAALQLYSKDPEAGASAITEIDPERGIQLRNIAREDKVRELTAQALGGGQATPTQATGQPGAPADGTAMPSATGETAPAPSGAAFQINPAALNELAHYDPKSAFQLQQFAQHANDEQKAQVAQHLQGKAQAANYLLSFPEGPERTQAFHSALPQLQGMGFTPQELASADLSTAMLTRDSRMGAAFSAPTELQRDAAFMNGVEPGLGNTYLRNKATPVVPVKGVDEQGNETLTFMRPSAGGASGGTAPSSAPPASAGHYSGPDFDGFKGGVMVSGRRTPSGNTAVGGVANSGHKKGDDIDYVPIAGQTLSQTLAAAQAYFGPTAHAFIDDQNHVHVSLPGYGKVPFFGERGAAGAPKGANAAQLIAQAHEAIQQGADPVAVHARLHKLGLE